VVASVNHWLTTQTARIATPHTSGDSPLGEHPTLPRLAQWRPHNGLVIARSRLTRLLGNHVLGRGASLVVLVLAGAASGCGNSSPRSATGTFTLANDTTSIVSVRDCVQSCYPAPTMTLAPAKSETLPMSSHVIGSVPSMLVITGYGSGPRCFLVPPNVLPKPLRLAVTDATAAQCDGRVPLPAPDVSALSPTNQSPNG
jgi:hypothetical protein